MAFIKIDPTIYGHPKVFGISQALGISQRQAGDLLIRFYCWAKVYAELGQVSYISERVEAGLEWDCKSQLLKTLIDNNILNSEGWINDWHEWGGAEIAERARKNPNKYKAFLIHYFGSGKFQEIPGKIPGNSAQRRGEEKRREDKNPNPLSPSAPVVSEASPVKKTEGSESTPKGDRSKPKEVYSAELEAIYAAYPYRRGDGASTGKSASDKKRLLKLMTLLPDYPFLDAIAYHRKTATREMFKNFQTFLNNLPDADEVRGTAKPDKPLHVCKPKFQVQIFDEVLKDFVDPPPICSCGKLLGAG